MLIAASCAPKPSYGVCLKPLTFDSSAELEKCVHQWNRWKIGDDQPLSFAVDNGPPLVSRSSS